MTDDTGRLTSVRHRHQPEDSHNGDDGVTMQEVADMRAETNAVPFDETRSDYVKVSALELEMQPLTISNGDDNSDDGLHSNDSITYPIKAVRQALDFTRFEQDLDSTRGDDWRQSLEDWLFPPHLPRSCQLLRRENIAVPLCYLLVGLLQGLSAPLVNVFPLDLGATEAQQTTLSSIRSLPSAFKLIFGFLSDNVPVQGYRRKPYMLVGWFVASFSMLMLLMTTNIKGIPARNSGCFESDTDDSEGTAKDHADSIPDDAPSVVFLSICLLGFGTGFWMADVMGDSIVAEKAKLEPESCRGSIQSSCYSYRFFGMMVAAPMSTYLYSTVGPYYVILLLALLPLTILPAIFILFEVKDAPVSSTRSQCLEIWNTVCSRAVWQPMAFVYIYNVMQVGNSAWREYLVTVLHFTSCQLNLILVTALVLLYLGILSYKYLLIDWSWRKVYILTTFLNGFFSLLQVLLIMGITFGISNFWFALGDDAFAEFISGIQFLPTTIMMVHLCPAGSEGASYAMFTTVNNSALSLSSALSTMLLRVWDVSREALEAGELSGMINLTYFTTFVQVSAIAFVGFLPQFKGDLELLKTDSQKSTVGGAIFLFVTFSSVLYAISVGILNIVNPGWMGES
jgi:hypothetical protein